MQPFDDDVPVLTVRTHGMSTNTKAETDETHHTLSVWDCHDVDKLTSTDFSCKFKPEVDSHQLQTLTVNYHSDHFALPRSWIHGNCFV